MGMHCQNILLGAIPLFNQGEMGIIATKIVDRVWVKHLQRGKHWVKHSRTRRVRKRKRNRKHHTRRAMADPVIGEEDQWEQLFNKETPAHIQQSIVVIEGEIFGEFKVKLREGVVMSHYW